MERHADNPFEIEEDLWEGWSKLPKRTRQAGLRKADARHAVAQAKAKLAVMAARIKLEIRKDPKKFELEKITEDGVKAALEVNAEYREFLAKIRRLEYEEDICAVEVSALVDLRRSYENKVQLLSIEYHSEREPRPLSQGAHELLNNKQRRIVRKGLDPDNSPGRTE